MIPEGNVKSITFNLSWTDDRYDIFETDGIGQLDLGSDHA